MAYNHCKIELSAENELFAKNWVENTNIPTIIVSLPMCLIIVGICIICKSSNTIIVAKSEFFNWKLKPTTIIYDLSGWWKDFFPVSTWRKFRELNSTRSWCLPLFAKTQKTFLLTHQAYKSLFKKLTTILLFEICEYSTKESKFPT